MRPTIKRALISVSDKTNLIGFAKALHTLGIEIISTGGTAKLLSENDIPVIEVSDYTGFPEMMDGRVKTLHPKIYGGLLGRRNIDDNVMSEHGIPPIDMVVVNLYPFEQTTRRKDCDLALAIENIDIGGPTMLRAAAKNYTAVTVVVDVKDYDRVLAELKDNAGNISDNTRFDLAVKTFEHTAAYEDNIANYLGSIEKDTQAHTFPRTYNVQFNKMQVMRYGENPHQQAAFYIERDTTDACLASSTQLQGKELSFNNIADTDAALECVKQYSTPACVIVKHANPCGVALNDNIEQAYQRAYQTDPTSAFGGIIAFNQTLNAKTARAILQQQFVEVIIAPDIEAEAQSVLQEKKNIRVMTCGQWAPARPATLDYKRVCGGLLVQEKDLGEISENKLEVKTQRQPTEQEMRDLMFTWKVAKFVKSNAIVYGKNEMTIGVGAGQMSRVYSARIAAIKATDANLQVAGSVMASDAFFPFRDGLDSAAELGVTAVIQPGGSMRDEEVIAAADEHNMAMVFTGMRHFRH